jgi:hypothetical protein
MFWRQLPTMGKLHPFQLRLVRLPRRRRAHGLRWPTTFGEIVQYGITAVGIGGGAALALNAYEAHQARQAILQGLPAGYQFPSCGAVRGRGLDPLYSYEPGYSPRMDRDGDGIACERYR